MRGGSRLVAELLFGYFLVKVFTVRCGDASEGPPPPRTPGGLIMESEDGDRDHEEPTEESGGQTADRCLGYYDVMGQWDPPFVCTTGSYLYCCGTCGFRFCCAFKSSRLEQGACKNYDTPPWMMTGRPPPRAHEAGGGAATPHESATRDRNHVIVYTVCGLVAVMALTGIFARLAVEKTRRPRRDHVQRVLAQVIRHPTPGDPSDVMGLYGQHYENLATRTTVNHLQFNNVEPGSMLLAHPYPIPIPYEKERPGSDLSSYATLKAVAEKSNDSLYASRHLLEMTTKGNLPMEPVDVEDPEPSNPYSPLKRAATTTSSAHNGHKGRKSKTHSSCSSLAAHYGTNTNTNTTTSSSNVSSPAAAAAAAAAAAHPDVVLKGGWDGQRHSEQRHASNHPHHHHHHHTHPHPHHHHHHTQKKHSHNSVAEKELHTIRYNMPPQPYFVTNSKTEVTV